MSSVNDITITHAHIYAEEALKAAYQEDPTYVPNYRNPGMKPYSYTPRVYPTRVESLDNVIAVIGVLIFTVGFVISSPAALCISFGYGVEGIQSKTTAGNGERALKQLEEGLSPFQGATAEKIKAVYTQLIAVHSGIGQKELLYSFNAFLISSGCALLTVSLISAVFAMDYFTKRQINMRIFVGVGISLAGVGATGAIITRVMGWLPRKEEVEKLQRDFDWLRQHFPTQCSIDTSKKSITITEAVALCKPRPSSAK